MPYINDENGYELPSDDAKIWRYMDFDKFYHLITSSRLFFCRIDKYPDKFEGVYPAFHYSEDFFKNYYSRFDYKPDEIKEIVEKELLLLRWNYYKKRCQYMINCWNESLKESEALWKVYAGFERGVVIQSTIERLCRAFDKCSSEVRIGKVKYIDHLEQKDIDQNFKPFLVKDLSYSYEQEIRCVLLDSQMKEEDEANGKLVEIDVATLISAVYISPKINRIVFENLKELMSAYSFDLQVSKLYEKPNYV